MYQFSRAIYRELQRDLVEGPRSDDARALLAACEATFARLARDRQSFAKPARSLFREVRMYFPMDRQLRVYTVIAVLHCNAMTRSGRACQRDPLPGLKYCPSHQHLEEDRSLTAA